MKKNAKPTTASETSHVVPFILACVATGIGVTLLTYALWPVLTTVLPWAR